MRKKCLYIAQDFLALFTTLNHVFNRINQFYFIRTKPQHEIDIELPDEDWDKELDIIKELKPEEFLDFIKAEFGLTNIIKLATHHPKLAVRQLFSLVKRN